MDTMENNLKSKEVKQKQWLKLTKKKSIKKGANRRKFIKGFAIYKKRNNLSIENSTHEFEYFTSMSKSFDWNKNNCEEIEKSKNENKNFQWKTLEKLDNINLSNKTDIKRLFWKNKKLENDDSNCEEMWTLGAKEDPQCQSNVDDRINADEQEKIFWKTSKISLPVNVNNSSNKHHNPKMLWRSLKHIQRLYEDNYVDVHHLSEIMNVEFKSALENKDLEIVSDCFFGKSAGNKPTFRKARLSRWAFLRHENDCRQIKSKRTKVNPYSKLFVSKKNSKVEKKKMAAPLKGYKYSSGSDESCNCSCCSCEKCLDEIAKSRCTDNASQLSKRNMAPNSEEDQIAFQNNRTWGMDLSEKEPLRPPVYNPEDYAISLKKWGRKANNGIQLPLYLSQSTGSIEKISSELSLQNKKQSSLSTKSSTSSIRSGDEKSSKKDKEFNFKLDKKDIKNKENINRGSKNDLNGDFRNPILSLTFQEGEMSLRQFSSVTELLGKLKVDLKYSFPSFVQEFVGDPVDGVTLLLELLRAVQLSQTSQQQRRPPQVLRKALLDEHSCLICLKHCLRCADATRRLASSPAGLFTLAVCIMSNVTQSRIMALELLTRACEASGGHKAVSEALSTLRLRYGEPVRFRFLVGMLSSAGTVELLSSAMKFINVFVESSPNIQQKVYIQAELEQAGFDAKTLRKTLPSNSESVKSELNKWEKSYFDVETLQNKVIEVNSLQEKIQLLEKRIQILQEEKGVLQSLEQCLKERCSELEEEVSTKTNTNPKCPSVKQYSNYKSQTNARNAEKGESTPAEDEGISSSEQELSQDEDYVKGSISYNSNQFEQITNSRGARNSLNCAEDSNRTSNRNQDKMLNACNLKNLKNIRSNKMKETNVDDGNDVTNDGGDSNEEEETTIDEVIEELENIVNDAETEAYAMEETLKLNERLRLQNKSRRVLAEEKNKISLRSAEKDVLEETEIIPSMLHPQPPRKAKSLVHIYFTGRDFDSQDQVKSEFFDEDSDSESSDSLLTAAREKRAEPKTCNKSLDIMDSFNSFSSVSTRTFFIKQEGDYEDSEMNMKMSYEERNIDEEEIKRKHLKNNFYYKNGNEVKTENFLPKVQYKDKKSMGQNKNISQKNFIKEMGPTSMSESLQQNGFGNYYEKTTSFQGVKSYVGEKDFNEYPVSNKPQRFVPTPVKRSQTFHMSTSEEDKLYKRGEIKPKPKMGVSGLDFQRSAEQKFKNDQIKYQNVECKKHVENKVDTSEKYPKKASKDFQKLPETYDSKNSTGLCRRGSFDGFFSNTKVERTLSQSHKQENFQSFYLNPSKGVDKSLPKLKSKNIEKMDEGLESLVDIVIASEEIKKPKLKSDFNLEVSKNIGPRTRMSLAESSLFNTPNGNGLLKTEDSPKPPKPAQRTSLTRNNSSSNIGRLPIEIKLTPVQPNSQHQVVYNFGIKTAKSEDSLVSAAKRYPPDGSSSPLDLKNCSCESKMSSDDKIPIYSTPIKQSKIQKFFGNPKFETGRGEDEEKINQKYFESNYACASNFKDKAVSPMPRTIQNFKTSISQKEKNAGAVCSNQQKTPTAFKSVLPKESSSVSKPNFLLGTYQPRSMKSNIPTKSSTSVLNSINNLNNSFLEKRNGIRKNFSSCSNSSGNENVSSRKCPSITSMEKVTDSLSGLY